MEKRRVVMKPKLSGISNVTIMYTGNGHDAIKQEKSQITLFI